MTVEQREKDWRWQTRMVRGGTRRSQFQETSEAIFMTSGFIYTEAEQAEAAFKNENDCFIYGRFANPTVEMFQDRMCLAEGAEACRGTATGMAAVFAALIIGIWGYGGNLAVWQSTNAFQMVRQPDSRRS